MCFAPQRRTLEMCVAQQWRALFRHLNFQKCSETVSFFLHFWLPNVLCATTAYTFSTSQLPKVVRCWCALCILTWKCASRHNGVQLFISHLATWLRTRHFSEPTFRPSGATNHWLFAHLHLLSSRSFSSHSFSSLIFSLRLFSSLTLPTSALPSVHSVGSLTSKLPSMIPEFIGLGWWGCSVLKTANHCILKQEFIS